jgi:cell division protein FtsI (penicillin-binding protein 3)/stage V sporulation protein D (sporulation-specific penicillin-binding protein)
MDPHTGEIAAMATRPDFDPNTYNTVTNPAVYSNQLVEGRYELGSIMKPLTMAAGIDSGAVTTKTTYDDTGCITLSGKKVCNYDFRARGVIPMQEVLNQSLNVGATFVQQRMGKQVFTRYMKLYGFDEKTGIDLPNEVTGSLATLGDGSGPDVNFSTASFGQGVSVSPIEMIRALAALANGGILPSPHVTRAIQLRSGITRSLPVPDGVRALSATTTQTVTNMLITVYDDALLNGEIKQEHYSIAAKTGTAQIAQPGGGYYSDRYLHSFFGYFPAHNPKFIVFLFVVEPHGVEYASASLAHPFDELARFLINYYDIPPDR